MRESMFQSELGAICTLVLTNAARVMRGSKSLNNAVVCDKTSTRLLQTKEYCTERHFEQRNDEQSELTKTLTNSAQAFDTAHTQQLHTHTQRHYENTHTTAPRAGAAAMACQPKRIEK